MVARTDSSELFVGAGGPASELPRGLERIDSILQRWWSLAELHVEADAAELKAGRQVTDPLVFGPARIAR